MTVYVVSWDNAEDQEVFAVFSEDRNARAFCRDWAVLKCKSLGTTPTEANIKELIATFLTVEPFELDVLPGGRSFDGVRISEGS